MRILLTAFTMLLVSLTAPSPSLATTFSITNTLGKQIEDTAAVAPRDDELIVLAKSGHHHAKAGKRARGRMGKRVRARMGKRIRARMGKRIRAKMGKRIRAKMAKRIRAKMGKRMRKRAMRKMRMKRGWKRHARLHRKGMKKHHGKKMPHKMKKHGKKHKKKHKKKTPPVKVAGQNSIFFPLCLEYRERFARPYCFDPDLP